MNEQNVYVNQLPDLSFYQGDTITIPFQFDYDDGAPIDLRKAKMVWYLCPYRQYRNVILEKNGIVSASNYNICYINLSKSDTKDLDFIKYTHQPVLEVIDNGVMKPYRRAEGSIIFNPMIYNALK